MNNVKLSTIITFFNAPYAYEKCEKYQTKKKNLEPVNIITQTRKAYSKFQVVAKIFTS